jgi:hypothetical protein
MSVRDSLPNRLLTSRLRSALGRAREPARPFTQFAAFLKTAARIIGRDTKKDDQQQQAKAKIVDTHYTSKHTRQTAAHSFIHSSCCCNNNHE